MPTSSGGKAWRARLPQYSNACAHELHEPIRPGSNIHSHRRKLLGYYMHVCVLRCGCGVLLSINYHVVRNTTDVQDVALLRTKGARHPPCLCLIFAECGVVNKSISG